MFLIIACIYGVIFGFATQKVIENKGYYENWFWWGFFFSFIALLVALSKPDQHHYYNDNLDSSREDYANEIYKRDILADGGWTCFYCNRLNAYNVLTCSCGKSKEESEQQVKLNEKIKASWQTESNTTDNNIDEISTIEMIEKYKKLLDSGAITQEEFDKKKASLL